MSEGTLAWRMAMKIAETPFWRLGLLATDTYAAITQIRRYFGHPFDELKLGLVGAEIGVYRGLHAEALLRKHPSIQTLYLIDPYEPYDQNFQMPRLFEAEIEAHRRLARFAPMVRWIRSPSPFALDDLPALDWVYIDGTHSYHAVRYDIEAAWPKIREGGVLGGDDFHEGCPGVIRAVCEFAAVNPGLKVSGRDWWIWKEVEHK